MVNEEHRGVTQLVGLGVLLAVIGVGSVLWKIHGLASEIHGINERNRMDPQQQQPIDVYEYSYKSGGGTQVVRTYKPAALVGESEEDRLTRWASMHRAAVNASLVQFPKDP